MKLSRYALAMAAGALLLSSWNDISLAQQPQSSPPIDTQAIIQAIISTPAQPASEAPKFGNFYSAQFGDKWPPLPADILNLPFWDLGEGFYLLCDTNVNYDALQQETADEASRSARGPEMMLKTGRGVKTSIAMDISYPDGTLWLEILRLGTNAFNTDTNSVTLILHGTTNDNQTTYEILGESNLACNCWVVETNFLGASGQDWTPITVPLVQQPTMFYRARISNLDSDQDGLPDWWEITYGLDPNNPDTGNTGVPDGNKQDSAGDGWTNLQKYQMGVPPNVFTTPPPPQGLTLQFNATNGAITLSWQPSSGAVTGYTVIRIDYASNTNWNVGTNTIFVDTSYPAYSASNAVLLQPSSSYAVAAIYRNGAVSEYAQSDTINPTTATIPAELALQSDGSVRLAVTDIPAGVSNVLVTLQDVSSDTTLTNFYLPVSSLTNGTYTFSGGTMPGDPNGATWYLQGVLSNGLTSYATFAGTTWPENYDGRTQLQQNVSFLLRAGSLTAPFSYIYFEDGFDPYTMVYELPPNYAYSSFYGSQYVESGLSWGEPFDENYRYANFGYSVTNVDATGYPTTGCQGTGASGLSLNRAHTFNFTPPAGAGHIPSVLASNQTRWILPYSDWTQLGVEQSGTNIFLPNNVVNYYGLRLLSVLLAYHGPGGTAETVELPAGQSIPVPPTNVVYFYPEFEQPQFQPNGYYFGRMGTPAGISPTLADPLPGQTAFPPSNAIIPFVAAVGQDVQIAAFAQQTIANGNGSIPVYVQQYFNKAFKGDGHGNASTNQTGFLAPDGEFTPTEVGQAILTTKPDAANGTTGQCAVNVIKMVLDVNHDGIMDLSFSGPDNSDYLHPYQFWINNDFDRLAPDPDDGTNYEDSVQTAGCPLTPLATTPDCFYRDALGHHVIPTERDLEDYARLWIAGVSNALASLPVGCTAKLYLTGGFYSGLGSIQLFKAAEPDGGTRYLTNAAYASTQTNYAISPFVATLGFNTLGPENAIVFGNSPFARPWPGDYFIFCGVSEGTAQVVLDICDPSGNVLAETFANIWIKDIKNMYERWTLGESPLARPANTASLAMTGLVPGNSPFSYDPPADSTTPYILFVHGWNMRTIDKDNFAETAFKRLYWQGYQGRFGSFRWPTDGGFVGISTMATDLSEKDNCDRSEYQAWQSASGLLAKFADLDAEYPNHVYLLAHSMGNVVAGEALRLIGSKQIVNTYVASQGSVSAHTYDATVTNYSFYYPPFSLAAYTPNIYGDRFSLVYGGGAGKVIDFYNTNDFALQRSIWQLNQLLKPDTLVVLGTSVWDYGYSGSANDPPPWNHFFKEPTTGTGTINFDIQNSLINRYEVMSFAAQSWTTAFGATPGVQNTRRNVDLSQFWPPDLTHPSHPYDEHFYHSGEFRGEYWQMQGYWAELLGPDAFNIK
jgi:hypothetical protein